MVRGSSPDGSTDVNPFVFDRPLKREQLIDRAQEIADLLDSADGGHSVCLYAPRRFGKTSLLRAVLNDADQRLDMIPVLVDLSEILSHADFAIRLEQAYRALRGPIARILSGMLPEVGLAVGLPGVSLRTTGKRAADDPLRTIHNLLDLPHRLFERTGRRALIVFDEFQELLALEGMDGVVRSHIQHHGDAATYFYSGSEPSMLERLFADRTRPLYGQARQMRLGVLPARQTAEDLDVRFRSGGRDPGAVIGELVAVMNGHPQRVMLLAHYLWEEVSRSNSAGPAALTAAFESMIRQLDTEMQATWEGLSVNERRVLSALAYGLSPQEGAALRLTGLRSASAAQRATQALTRRAFVERDADGDLVIVDPVLDRWLARRHLPPMLYVLPLAKEQWIVTDGPSLAFTRSKHRTRAEAEASADEHLRQQSRGGEVSVVDVDTRDELPDWAQGVASLPS
ncbi:MAG: hypothetical protein ACHQHO_11155 [Solirubrobacterales bacterium]